MEKMSREDKFMYWSGFLIASISMHLSFMLFIAAFLIHPVFLMLATVLLFMSFGMAYVAGKWDTRYV